ncbi:MAG: ABC transporter ATP-binding protein [Lachnospiraceae bacterium]|nr:ABC transporter ATP-binding protein [Lachnospiraceae bacterium]
MKRNKKGKQESVEQEKKNPLHKEYGVFKNMGFVFKHMIGYEKKLLMFIVMGLICEPLMRYFWTFLPKLILDLITREGTQRELLLMMGCVTVFQLVLTMTTTYYHHGIGWRYIGARFYMMLKMNRKAMKIDFEHLENPDVMDCYQKAQNACGDNSNGVEGMMRESTRLLESTTTVLLGMGILSTLNVWLVVLMVGIAVINFLIVNRTNKITKMRVWDPLATWWRKRWYMQNVTTNFDAAKDIRMFGLKDWLKNKYEELNKTRYEAQKVNATFWFWTSISGNIFWCLSQILVYWWLVRAMVQGELTIGNFSLYLASAATFFEYVSTLLNGMAGVLARSREVDDFRSFLDFDGGDGKRDGKELPKTEKYEFVFENVSFQYPKAERYALKNLNLTLKAGERLAVVGLNGAGKSTMIKLLLRLYEPTEGRILLNGVDVREYNKEKYYEAFAPVFQQVELFAFPMEENVSMKEPGRTDGAKAKECLEAAGLTEKIASLPNGTKTELLKIVYDDGVDLSGGEKQKLALARALYKDAPVVVLDEPTAALDALAEAKLYEDFDKLIGGKTAVYISHRLSSTQFCNHVAMFADGEMVEYGTHAELMEKNGAYAEMFQIQAQYYIEETEKAEREVAANGEQ